ncbi:MAG: 5-deoxy-glucuronate isomerase, partial [Acidimicrobiaceae bacterium]|nr:5-deoxy-glucuronate isomerase [Acidimicrobiaceae bacterium]
MSSASLIRPSGSTGRILHVTPRSAGWDYVEFAVVETSAGAPWTGMEHDRETAIVPLAGSGRVCVGDDEVVELSRASVFTEMAPVLYLPPGVAYRIESESRLRASVGSAPAEGRYPVRVFEPAEMRVEIRGGGQAHRQVVHSLAHPLPAEKLILYEVYVPRGTWSGWPPH